MNLRTLLAGTAGALIGISFAGVAYAQDTAVQAETSVSVQASTTRPGPLPLGPRQIKDIRQSAQERIQNLRDGIGEQRIEALIELRNASSADERRGIMIEMRDDRADMRDRAAEIRGTVKERIQALVKTHVGAVMRRSENALNMFDNLVDRMTSRIEKLKERGADTAAVEGSLATSVSLMASAEADLSALKTLVESVNDSSDPETVRSQIRAAIEKLTASVKAAHASLLSTARALTQVSATVSTEVEVNVQ